MAGTADLVRLQWPLDHSIDVAAQTLAPKVAASELEKARTGFAAVAVSTPVTVDAGGTTFTLEPADFADAVVLTPAADGTITPRADDAKLVALVHDAAVAAGAQTEPRDATVTFSGLVPTVHDAVPGHMLDDDSIRTAVWRAISSTERTATVVTRETQPQWTTQRLTATLPKEKISSFTTYFPCCQARAQAIRTAGSLVDGTYLLPGGQLSLQAVLGDAAGADGGGVPAGTTGTGPAGPSDGDGLSQVATTVFNAAFFAGMRLDAWTPHASYVSGYPEGREARFSSPDVDLRWTNSTDGGVLVRVRTTDTSMTVDLHGTKTWDVGATTSDRYDVVPPKKVVDGSPTCVPQDPVEGFAVDVSRIFRKEGTVVRTEKLTTRYRPEDDVTCTYHGG